MNRFRLTITILLFFASLSYADIYRWTDKDGVLHITDDMHKVPEGYRHDVDVDKIEPSKAVPAEKAPSAPRPKYTAEEKKTLYGDNTLEWWERTFTNKKDALSERTRGFESKKSFVEVFEGGRRFGQLFSESDVERHKKYKAELPAEEKEIEALEKELKELRRKARIYGVPRAIRE